MSFHSLANIPPCPPIYCADNNNVQGTVHAPGGGNFIIYC